MLPKFTCAKYLKVKDGSYFGVIDIIASCFNEQKSEYADDSSEDGS